MKIYIIKCEQYYKIGITSRDIAKRIEDMKTGNPFQIYEYFHLECANANKLEKELHLLWSHKNQYREWFELSESDLQNIIKYININAKIAKDKESINSKQEPSIAENAQNITYVSHKDRFCEVNGGKIKANDKIFVLDYNYYPKFYREVNVDFIKQDPRYNDKGIYEYIAGSYIQDGEYIGIWAKPSYAFKNEKDIHYWVEKINK